MRNDGGGEEGQEGSGDGLGDCGFEVQIQWLVIEEVENAVGDAGSVVGGGGGGELGGVAIGQ